MLLRLQHHQNIHFNSTDHWAYRFYLLNIVQKGYSTGYDRFVRSYNLIANSLDVLIALMLSDISAHAPEEVGRSSASKTAKAIFPSPARPTPLGPPKRTSGRKRPLALSSPYPQKSGIYPL